ncbi:MAG: hypothetical protein K2K93_03735 [Muribaculaceae bacterium]|nr:hypothetical protein [Muribaculaceae bacterium]
MKKTIFAAVAAFAMLIPASLRAQDDAKEYNMVITLQNGTTITLGHNDIKNITFNGEEIEISGNVVNTITELDEKAELALQRTYMLESYLDAKSNEIQNQIYTVQDYLNALNQDLQIRTEELKDRVNNVESTISMLADEVENLKVKVSTHDARLDDLDMHITQLSVLVNEIMSQLGM